MSNYYAISTTFVPGQKVRSDEVNIELNGISAGFDYLPADQNSIKEGKAYRGVEGGSGNSYTVTMDDTRTAYADGDRVSFKATHTNTGAASIGLDAVGLRSLVDPFGSALTAGALVSGRWYEAVFIAASNHFQLMSPHATLITDVEDQVGYAEEWASKAEDSLISTDAGGNGVDEYSALHWAAKAAADLVLTNADVVSTNADVVSTNADVVLTNADVVLTGLDVASTNADVVLTNADVTYAAEWAVKAEDSLISVAAGGNGTTDYSALHWAAKASASAAAAAASETNADGYATAASADAISTAADALSTAADAASTAADVISTAADAAATAADVVTTNADVVLTNADVTYTAEWANKAEDSLISAAAGGDQVDDYSALHWANKAAASAAGLNLPSIVGGDADKILEVNSGETGYELTARAATETATGFVELATNAEVTTGSDTDRAVTPAGLHQKTSSETAIGLVELATNAEVTTGTDTARAVTPAGLHQKTASATAVGLVELATDAEALTGTDTSRAVTPSNVAAVLGGTGYKNIIINGGMDVWQRGISFTGVGNEFTADRWKWSASSDAVVDILQATSTAAPRAFYLAVSVTTADASIAAGQFGGLVYLAEGPDCRGLRSGTSLAKTVTLSFKHAHTKTGTHSGSFRNGATNRSYTFEYTQSAANTWEESEVVIDLDTSGTWLISAATVGLRVHFALAVGTNTQLAPGTWSAGNYLGTSNQVNNLDTIGNTFRITEVQLEIGEFKTTFEHVPYTTELAKCQRYYQESAGEASGFGSMQSTTSAQCLHPLPVEMMSDPSVSTTVGAHRVRSGSSSATPSAVASAGVESQGVNLNWITPSLTQFAPCTVYSIGTSINFKRS